MHAEHGRNPSDREMANVQRPAIAHPLIQYRHMIAALAASFHSQPPAGYRRGIDHYSAASFPAVLSVAANQFRDVHGRFPDLISPRRLSDKIFWSKFFRPLKVPESGNKLLTARFIPKNAKDLVRCPPVVWHSPRPRVPRAGDVEPGIYYLKANFGSDRFRRVSYPVSEAEAELLDAEFAGHLAKAHNWLRGEWWYHEFPRELLLELAVGTDRHTTSWNFLVIAGEIELIIVYQKLDAGNFRKSYLSPAFDPLPQQDGSSPAVFKLPSLNARKHMAAAARAIGAPLRFVRIDFLLDDEEQPYLGEVTFTPGNAVARLSDDLDANLGAAWDLSAEGA
jgi:hypothetical protein